jgi:magnesium chelatase family protein
MNPCPCGYYGDVFRQCTCTPGNVQKYQKRISGPLPDRIDLRASRHGAARRAAPAPRLERNADAVRACVTYPLYGNFRIRPSGFAGCRIVL